MQLEDYFWTEKFDAKFGPAEEIWIKGNNIPIDPVIEEYKRGSTPEKIATETFPSLSLDKVYATILYYLINKDAVEAHMEEGKRICEANYQEWLTQEQPPVVKRLMALKAEREAAAKASNG